MGEKRPREASRSVKKYLAPNENVALELRQHWARVLPAVLSCFLGLVLVLVAGFMAPSSMGTLTNVSWWIWLVLVGHLLWRVIEWWDESFVITNKRLILVHGIFIKKVAMMPLSKVTDMSYNRSLGARILGYGTFVMESAGQEQALNTINFVRWPDAIYRQLCGLIFGEDTDERPHVDASSHEPAEDPEAWFRRREEEHTGLDDPWETWHQDWDSELSHDAESEVSASPSTVPLRVKSSETGSRDDTDPYGLVTDGRLRGEERGMAHYPRDIARSNDSGDDSAWSVSHEHATRPQPARRSHNVDPPVE